MLGIVFSDYGNQYVQQRRFIRALESADEFDDLPADVRQMILDGEQRLPQPR